MLANRVDEIRRGRHPAFSDADFEFLDQTFKARPVTPVDADPALNLVLLGGPGSGKGTQAAALCKTFELPHVSTGDLFREHIRKQTDLGQLARSYMDRGELVPDDVTERMVASRLALPDARREAIAQVKASAYRR